MINMNKILLVTIGASGSGKTFWANSFVQQNRSFKNFNRDDIRTMLCGNHDIWSQGHEFEQLVTKVQEASVKEALKAGFSAVVSDTNLNSKTLRRWQEIAAEFDAEFQINDSFLNVSRGTCIERDAQRERPVGKVVIDRQFEQAKKLKLPLAHLREIEKVEINPALRWAIVCDLDGTACLMEKVDKTAPNYRNPYDASTCENDLPNDAVLSVLRMADKEGYFIFLVSGREEKYRLQTEAWLVKHDVLYYQLLMRKTGDFRNDADIKEEIYRNDILPISQRMPLHFRQRMNLALCEAERLQPESVAQSSFRLLIAWN